MNDYFIADLHLDHPNIMFHCNRNKWIIPNPDYNPNAPHHFKYNNPYRADIQTYHENMYDHWNSIVSKQDRIFVVGDLAYSNHLKHVLKLNGRKILITGNHDKMNTEALKHFKEVHEMGCRKKIENQDITLCHYGMRTWASSCHGSWHLYGHSHGRLPEFPETRLLSFDVGVDVWGFTPVPWEVIKYKMNTIIDTLNQTPRDDEESENPSNKLIFENAQDRANNILATNLAILDKFGLKYIKMENF